MKFQYYFITIALLTASCNRIDTVHTYPKSREEIKYEELGSIISEEDNRITLFSSNKPTKTQARTGSIAWEAALDTIKFIPLISTDLAGGVILTDWYQTKDNINERYKLRILVRSGQLSADAIEVTAYKQKKRGLEWVDIGISDDLASEIESKILTRAKSLKIEEYKNVH